MHQRVSYDCQQIDAQERKGQGAKAIHHPRQIPENQHSSALDIQESCNTMQTIDQASRCAKLLATFIKRFCALEDILAIPICENYEKEESKAGEWQKGDSPTEEFCIRQARIASAQRNRTDWYSLGLRRVIELRHRSLLTGIHCHELLDLSRPEDAPAHLCKHYEALLRFGATEAEAKFLLADQDAVPEKIHKPELLPPVLRRDFCSRSYSEAYPDCSIDFAYNHWIEHGFWEHRHGFGINKYQHRKVFTAGTRYKFGINYFGLLSACSGLGNAARGYVRVLKQQGIPVACIDITAKELIRRRPSLVKEEEMPYSINIFHINADTCETYIQDPSILDNKYNIGLWVWELAALPAWWRSSFSAFDEIWCPSEFCKNAIQALTQVPVYTIPHAIEDGAFLQETPLKNSLPSTRRFAYFFDASSHTERKNPISLIHAFKKAFGSDATKQLILKCHSVSDKEVFAKLESACSTPNITLETERYTIDKMNSLRRSIDFFVSPHRSEGFGLNVAEMMAAGKVVAATDYSATSEYLNCGNGLPVSFDLIELDSWIGPYPKGYTWAGIDEDRLCEALADMGSMSIDQYNLYSQNARSSIWSKYSNEQVGKIAFERIISIKEVLEGKQIHNHPTPPSHGGYKLPQFIRSDPHHDFYNTQFRVKISIVVPVYNISVPILIECVESVVSQTYPNWELCIYDDASNSADTLDFLRSLRGTDQRIRVVLGQENRGIAGATNKAIAMATGDFVGFLDNDDKLHPNALSEVVKCVSDNPLAEVIYTDEDKLDPRGQHVDPYFKPDWSPEHLESCMYILHFLVIKKRLLLDLGGVDEDFSGAQDFDLALRASLKTKNIYHIPKILYHWRIIPGSAAEVVDAKPYAIENGRRAVDRHVKSKFGTSARSVHSPILVGTFATRVDRDCPVTILIPTCYTLNDDGRPFIGDLVGDILEKSSYSNYIVHICDDGAQAMESILPDSLLSDHRIRCSSFERTPGERFNYAAKVNYMCASCQTDNLIILNDDMRLVNSDWIEALLTYSVHPEIGVVGGRLLHADNTVQHVGCILGVHDSSTHPYHGAPSSTIGYNGFTHITRNYSVVTGACMALRKEVFEMVGGFETEFRTDFNDTDFCLKIISKGLRVVYTPHAELIHFESKSCIRKQQDPSEVEEFRRRWNAFINKDPYYNPNLTRLRGDFSIDVDHIDLLAAYP